MSTEYNYITETCAVKSCKWQSQQPNGEGALDLIIEGGYADFTDTFGENPKYIRLCHKHAHKFASWLNNPDILHPFYGHSHNGSEPGFWYGHISWEQRTWLSHLNIFFVSLWKFKSIKVAKKYLVDQIKGHIRWSRKNINDSTTDIVWSELILNLFFLENAYKGIFYKIYRYIRRKFKKS